MKKKYQVSLIAITVMLLGAICLATSYALWTVNKTQTGNNIVETGCFEITLSDQQGIINLENAYPITDEASKSLTPYTFKINNTCTVAAKYMINLEVLPTSDLDTKYLAASIDNEEPVKLKNAKAATPTIDGVTVSKTIGSGIVGAGKISEVAIRIWIDESVTLTDIEVMEKTLNAKIVIIGSGASEPLLTCIRAKTLHTETCNGYCSSMGSFTNGSTITYGNTTTTPGVLSTGDAFTCDVNGDGVYNEDTERFYYVSDLYTGGEEGSETWDEDTAVLIYYSNTIINENTITSNYTTTINYDTIGINNNGPINTLNHIPTTEQWSKMSINETRQVRTETGLTSTAEGAITFAGYTDKAARLLTTQELNRGCELTNSTMNIMSSLETDKCRFLFEKTGYATEYKVSSYWLENPRNGTSGKVWVVNGGYLQVMDIPSTNDTAGVRPTIEVAKTDITY